jgi:hypothetical protein
MPGEGSTAPYARPQTSPLGRGDRGWARDLQNLRRGHYELATDVPPSLQLSTAFTELALAM